MWHSIVDLAHSGRLPIFGVAYEESHLTWPKSRGGASPGKRIFQHRDARSTPNALKYNNSQYQGGSLTSLESITSLLKNIGG